MSKMNEQETQDQAPDKEKACGGSDLKKETDRHEGADPGKDKELEPEQNGASAERETADNSQSEEETAESAPQEQGTEKKPKDEEELSSKYLRLAADFQNFKRRTEKEKNDIYAFANEKLVVELLDVIDNFERALVHTEEGSSDAFAKGMNMIFKQFKGVLEKSGVEEIKAEGEDFDPNFHHAVMTENSVEFDSGKVTQVLQRGYMLNKKVIRPAMVKVAE